ncbi:MAG: hypothetical protein OEL87_01500 [Nanoarchaeota archaeon]|nr:hypothetical protein [Nanoarchaeota archaeon]
MGISWGEFQALSCERQRWHIRKHEYYMGEKRVPKIHEPIGNGPASVDFYEKILGVSLNGSRDVIIRMNFTRRYNYCLGCGEIYELDGETVGHTNSLSDEFDVFNIRPDFCNEGCINEHVLRLNREYVANSFGRSY